MRIVFTILILLFAGIRSYAQYYPYSGEPNRQIITEDNVFALIALEEKSICTDENDFSLDLSISLGENEEVTDYFPESENVNRYQNTGIYTTYHLLPFLIDLPPPSAC